MFCLRQAQLFWVGVRYEDGQIGEEEIAGASRINEVDVPTKQEGL